MYMNNLVPGHAPLINKCTKKTVNTHILNIMVDDNYVKYQPLCIANIL